MAAEGDRSCLQVGVNGGREVGVATCCPFYCRATQTQTTTRTHDYGQSDYKQPQTKTAAHSFQSCPPSASAKGVFDFCINEPPKQASVTHMIYMANRNHSGKGHLQLGQTN